jgi:hypothetical protein
MRRAIRIGGMPFSTASNMVASLALAALTTTEIGSLAASITASGCGPVRLPCC